MKASAFFLISIVVFAGCYSDRWVRTPVLEEKSAKVYLERYLEDGEPKEKGFNHPKVFDPMELGMILQGLAYQNPKLFSDPVPTPVFTEAEVGRLCPALAEALASADSKERIRFISFNIGGGLIFSTERKTEGVIFLKEKNRMHIAFSMINEERDIDEMDYQHTPAAGRDPLRIISSGTPLLPTRWYRPHLSEKGGSLHPLWVEVNLLEARELFKALAKAPAKAGEEAAVPRTPVQAEEAAGKTIPAGKSEEEDDALKEKLQRLKEYFDEGLIDEEEYKAKKKELLEGLGEKG